MLVGEAGGRISVLKKQKKLTEPSSLGLGKHTASVVSGNDDDETTTTTKIANLNIEVVVLTTTNDAASTNTGRAWIIKTNRGNATVLAKLACGGCLPPTP